MLRSWRIIKRLFHWAEHTHFGAILLDSIFDWRKGLIAVLPSIALAIGAIWSKLAWPEVVVLFMGAGAFMLGIVVAVVWLIDRWKGTGKQPLPTASTDGGLSLDFSEDTVGCRVETKFSNGVPATFYRIKVINDTGKKQNSCRGRVVEIKRKNIVGDFENYGFVEQVQVTWATHGIASPSLITDIPNKQHEFLDVFYVTPLENAVLATHGFVQPNSCPNPFSEEGEYILTTEVTSDETFQKMRLLFAIAVVPNRTMHEINARVRRYLPT